MLKNTRSAAAQKRKHKYPPQTSQRRRISQGKYGMFGEKSLEGILIRKSNRNVGRQVTSQGVRRMAQNDTPVSESKVISPRRRPVGIC